MKVIIAGSRTITDYELIVKAVLESKFNVTEVVSGHAAQTKDKVTGKWMDSVDRLGERFSLEYLHQEPKLFPADWDKHHKAAGPIRNRQMAEYADALILVWNGASKGSANMLAEAKRIQLQIYEKIVTKQKTD